MIQFLKTIRDRFYLACLKIDDVAAAIPQLYDSVTRLNHHIKDLIHRPYPIVLSATGTFRNGDMTEPGSLGRFLWMTPGVKHEVHLQPQVTFEDIEVVVEGGAVIHDVQIGNRSQVIGFHEGNAILRVKCNTECQVGSRIKVILELPKP